MERDEPSGDDAYVETRIPPALRDRVEELFRQYRGYEPSTLQESLSVVCDLAEQRLDATSETGTGPDRRAPTARSDREPSSDRRDGRETRADADRRRDGVDAGQSGPASDPAEEIREAIDEVFPTDWNADAESARLLPKVVNRYVSGTDASTRAERENAALSAVAAHEGTSSDALRETLVEGIYGSSTLPGDLASEFFSEALEKVERRIDDAQAEALSPIDLVDDVSGGGGPDAGAGDVRVERSDLQRESPQAPSTGDPTAELELGPESGDLPPGIADDVASDGGAVQSVDQRIDNLFEDPNGLTDIGIESLVEGVSADCEICGTTRSVGELETTTEASGDRRVDLVCPDCVPE